MKSVITKLLELPIVICAFSFLFLCIAYLDLYKTRLMGHLTSLSPQKTPLFKKGPSYTYKKHMVLFFPPQLLFMHLLQNCRARRNPTPLWNCGVKTRTLILKGTPGAEGERRAVSWELFTLSQMISSLGRMDCSIESITGCHCRGAFVWAAVEQDGGAQHKRED